MADLKMLKNVCLLIIFLLLLKWCTNKPEKHVVPIGAITVPVNVYIHEKSRWTVSNVKSRMNDASSYYEKKCDIVFDVKNITVGNALGLYQLKTWDDDVQFAYLNPDPLNSVFVIFTGNEIQHKRQGFARYTSSLSQNPRVINTIYMFECGIKKQNAHGEYYDTLIHEFGHILMSDGHNNIHKNFLSSAYDGMEITPSQCTKMRAVSSAIIDGSFKATKSGLF